MWHVCVCVWKNEPQQKIETFLLPCQKKVTINNIFPIHISGISASAWLKPFDGSIFLGTPLKFNMEPENQPLEEEIPIRNHHFQVPC